MVDGGMNSAGKNKNDGKYVGKSRYSNRNKPHACLALQGRKEFFIKNKIKNKGKQKQ